jgi:hypothetical protein
MTNAPFSAMHAQQIVMDTPKYRGFRFLVVIMTK